jgi:hypothetical protein
MESKTSLSMKRREYKDRDQVLLEPPTSQLMPKVAISCADKEHKEHVNIQKIKSDI